MALCPITQRNNQTCLINMKNRTQQKYSLLLLNSIDLLPKTEEDVLVGTTSQGPAGGEVVPGLATKLSTKVEALIVETSIGKTNPLVETGNPVEEILCFNIPITNTIGVN